MPNSFLQTGRSAANQWEQWGCPLNYAFQGPFASVCCAQPLKERVDPADNSITHVTVHQKVTEDTSEELLGGPELR